MFRIYWMLLDTVALFPPMLASFLLKLIFLFFIFILFFSFEGLFFIYVFSSTKSRQLWTQKELLQSMRTFAISSSSPVIQYIIHCSWLKYLTGFSFLEPQTHQTEAGSHSCMLFSLDSFSCLRSEVSTDRGSTFSGSRGKNKTHHK